MNADGTIGVSITGSIMIGSVSAQVDSIYVQSGTMYIASGNVTITGMTGSIGAYGSVYTIGSLNIATDLASIGSHAGIGSIIGSVYQATNPWVISGTATVAGSVYSTGSINIATSLQSIGSFTSMALGSVAITNIGSVIQSTSPWVVSGTSTIAGSAYVTGSVNIASIPSFIGSVNVTNFAQIGSLTTQTMVGSVNVTNFAQMGSLAVQSISGSVYVTGSLNMISTAGSIGIYGAALEDFTLRYTMTLAYTGLSIGSVVEYIGLAAPGTSKTAAFTWQIRRNTYASDGNLTDIGFADGNANFDNSWADRASGTYT